MKESAIPALLTYGGGQYMNNNRIDRPSIAVIDGNTLATVGLKTMLQEVLPIMDVDVFGSFAELEASHPENYFHYFVAMEIVVRNMAFFTANRHKTIVLTPSLDADTQLAGFHCLCTNVPESLFVKSLLALEQEAHAHGRNLPPMSRNRPVLSDREVEVMALIVRGYINKEIADRLGIGLSTVVTHRKNIMEKLHVHSVSALTIYAVMNGYVDINKI